jgi:hypothetical protein
MPAPPTKAPPPRCSGAGATRLEETADRPGILAHVIVAVWRGHRRRGAGRHHFRPDPHQGRAARDLRLAHGLGRRDVAGRRVGWWSDPTFHAIAQGVTAVRHHL